MSLSQRKVRNEMKRLLHLINYYNASYFQKGISEISDYDYDKLLERLVQLEEAYPQFRAEDTPTNTLGESPWSLSGAVPHQRPMLSLAKTYLESEVAQFVARVQKALPHAAVHFICEPKIDGIALSILYENGCLVRMVTRGDGQQGDDVTPHAVALLNIPNDLNHAIHGSFEVRGEACMSKAVFETCNQQRAAQGLPLWANPRNLAAGTLKTLNGERLQDRSLLFYGYGFYAQAPPCLTQQEALEQLVALGFPLMATYKVCCGTEDIMEYIHYWQKHKADLPVGIDGIVIKVNDLHQQQLLGHTAKSPRWALAYKYQPDRTHSILEKVSFQVGRSGVVTPVAHFQPVELAGTVVRRASLYNASILTQKKLHKGDTVWVEKGGDIIPKVVSVDTAKRLEGSPSMVFTSVCPACGAVLQAGKVAYYCPNKQSCLPQLRGALLHFAHRKAMDIPTLGPKTIAVLLRETGVKNVADLYTLGYEEVCALPLFQERSTKKLLASIAASKGRPFDKVLFALGIPYVGETVAKKLAQYFGNMTQLQHAEAATLLKVPDVGEAIAQSILAYFQDPYQQAILQRLQVGGLQFACVSTENVATLPLATKNFVISGTFQQFTRAELVTCIEQAGGTLLSVISAKVNYLLAGDKAGSSKLAKATALAIPILSEAEVVHMIEQHGASIRKV